MASTYTLTVKFAPSGTKYYDEKKHKEETSTWGHVWLEVRRPGEPIDGKPSFSAGWSTGESKRIAGEDNLSNRDWFRYRGDNISSITVEITEEQFKKLSAYPNLAAAGKIPGFRSVYDAGDNSCIDFSGKGLGYIGLADKDFDGSGLFWARPDKQVNAFLEQIAKNRAQGADLTVEHRGRTYVFGDNERDVKKFWKEVDPYWYLSQNLEERQNQPQYAQTKPLTIDDMPPKAQELCRQCENLLVKFHEKNGTVPDMQEVGRMAAATGVEAYRNKFPEIKALAIREGDVRIGYRYSHGQSLYASVDAETASRTPVEESVTRSHQAEQELARAAEQREMEIAQYHAQSRGMSLS